MTEIEELKKRVEALEQAVVRLTANQAIPVYHPPIYPAPYKNPWSPQPQVWCAADCNLDEVP